MGVPDPPRSRTAPYAADIEADGPSAERSAESKHWRFLGGPGVLSVRVPSQLDYPSASCDAARLSTWYCRIAVQIAHSLDLNDLDNLSRTCRQIHYNLIQFRYSLIPCTLRCVNDADAAALPASYLSAPADLATLRTQDPARAIRARLTSGRVGPCAHDLVAPCRRCGTAICRNCVARAPPVARLSLRLRRLCTVCLHAPLSEIMTEASTATTTSSAASSPPSSASEAEPPDLGALQNALVFTAQAFERAPCSCPDGAFLCRSCALSRPGEDTTYRRIWRWRTRYSREGIGTGIGEGTEGVKCARGPACLAAQEIEVELDCGPDEEPLATPLEQVQASDVPPLEMMSGAGDSGSGTPTHDDRGEAGYMRQEIEGIGGVLHGKVKKRVRVGRPVREYEDERDNAKFLQREERRDRRAWCGWCDRVIPGKKDITASI